MAGGLPDAQNREDQRGIKSDKVVVFITAGTEQEADNIARLLVEQRKAACASILPKVHSLFWWHGKLDSAEETLLIVKTRTSLLPQVIDMVEKAHSYDVPEIIALPIIGGNERYLRWILDETDEG